MIVFHQRSDEKIAVITTYVNHILLTRDEAEIRQIVEYLLAKYEERAT